MILLVVVAIGLFWYVGYQDKKNKEELKAKYLQELLAEQKNLELAVQANLQNTDQATIDQTLPPLPKLNTNKASSTEAFRQYGLGLVTALAPLEKKRGNEITAILSAIDKNDPTLLKPVMASRLLHEEAFNNLATLTVPQIFVTRHQALMLKLQIISNLLSKMEKALDQPKLALASSNSFLTTGYPNFLNALQDLDNSIRIKGVTFSASERAEIYLSFYQNG